MNRFAFSFSCSSVLCAFFSSASRQIHTRGKKKKDFHLGYPGTRKRFTPTVFSRTRQRAVWFSEQISLLFGLEIGKNRVFYFFCTAGLLFSELSSLLLAAAAVAKQCAKKEEVNFCSAAPRSIRRKKTNCRDQCPPSRCVGSEGGRI